MTLRYPLMIVLASAAWVAAAVAAEGVGGPTLVPLHDLVEYPERRAPASVVSVNDTDLSAELAARVLEIAVRVGDVVDAGTVIARLDCGNYEAAARQVSARLAARDRQIELAERRLERTRRLNTTQSVSEEALDERSSELAVLVAGRAELVADLDRARLDVGRCTVVSPFRALIEARLAAVGQYLSPGTAIVHVIDIAHLEVSVVAPERDVALIEAGAGMALELADRNYPLTLRRAVLSVDPRTRNRELRFEFAAGKALPGAAGQLAWRDPRPHLPGDLLVRRDGALGVMVAAGGEARFVPLPDAQAGRATPVELPPDTVLVTEGRHALRSGDALSAAP